MAVGKLSLVVVSGFLTVAASLVVEHELLSFRLSSCGSRAPAQAQELLCADRCSAARGVFLDGMEPRVPHWPTDS